MPDEGQEKTEEPTQKKINQSREKGKVPHSRETSTVMVFIAAVIVFAFLGKAMVARVSESMQTYFQFGGYVEMSSLDTQLALTRAFHLFFRCVWPLWLAVFITGIAASVGQFGLVFATKKLEPDFNRLNPASGLKKLFSLRSSMEGVKSILKIILIGTILYFVFRQQLARVESLMGMPVDGILDHVIAACLQMTWAVVVFMLALAAFDFWYQRWEYRRGLRMTKQEVRDEAKDVEGDPMIKQRIRQTMYDRARQRMMKDVETADVVITNPTHLAIALKYDPEKMRAPKVVAKGADYLAEKIRAIAKEHDVPMVENKPVARILYRTVKVGGEAPPDLYKAIAGILAYVYRTAKSRPKWA